MYINECIWSMHILFHKENIFSGDTPWAYSLSALEECASKPVDANQLPSRKKLAQCFLQKSGQARTTYLSSTSLISLLVVHYQQNKTPHPDMTNHGSIAPRSLWVAVELKRNHILMSCILVIELAVVVAAHFLLKIPIVTTKTRR